MLLRIRAIPSCTEAAVVVRVRAVPALLVRNRSAAIRQIRTVRGRVRCGASCDMLYCDCACVLCVPLQVSCAGVEP